MKVMYCWRCGTDTPMFDEEEFETVASSYACAVKKIKSRVRFYDAAVQQQFIQEQYRPVLEVYHRITGREWTADPSHLMYHRISTYGPPLPPLREAATDSEGQTLRRLRRGSAARVE